MKKVFRALGLEVMKSSTYQSLLTSSQKQTGKSRTSEMLRSLERLKKIGIVPETIIDVGAAKGHWFQGAREVFPNVKGILVEPLAEQLEEMDPSLKMDENIKIINAVAGDTDSFVDFVLTDDLDGSGVYSADQGEVKRLPQIRLDQTQPSQGAIILKLDTHGYEFPILDGAQNILDSIEAVVVEIYGFYVSPTAPLFHELSAKMMSLGYRFYDIVEVVRRTEDGAFWQADAVYVKDSHPVFQNNRYS